jgi:hypothetical protein
MLHEFSFKGTVRLHVCTTELYYPSRTYIHMKSYLGKLEVGQEKNVLVP